MKDYLELRLGLWSNYHHHKETMANAGFLAQMGLFGALITEAVWPPDWVSRVTQLPNISTFVVYFVLWYLIHYYTRWQLINKRIAAIYVAGFDRAYRAFLLAPDAVDKSQFSGAESNSSRWRNFLSGLFFVPGGYPRMDASVNGLPTFIASEVQRQFRDGSGAETLEVLITYTSIGLMVLVGIKIFLGG